MEVLPDDEGQGSLLMCCGEISPLGKDASVVVKPSVGGEMGFVTVHDYLEVVHPWLVGLREDLVAAIVEQYGEQLAGGTELVVNLNAVEDLMVEPKGESLARGDGKTVVFEIRAN